MRSQLTLLFALLLSLTLTAQKRTLDVGSFDELSFGTSGTLYLTQGPDEEVVVDCSDEVFDKIEFEVKGDRLVIKNKGKWGWRNNIRRSDLDIYVTMKEIEAVSLSGSGVIVGKNTVNSEELQVSISGSGNIELDLQSDDLSARISGSGSIELSGAAGEAEARISGSGKVRAEDLTVDRFEASISGSGNCYITAKEEVTANISGSGNVYYSGEPKKVISNSSGSGKIRKM